MMKLVTETKTKAYELTYLVPGSMTDSELTAVQETVQGLVKKHSGKILSEENWGRKPLSYRIRKAGKNHSEATYLHLTVELAAQQAPLFEKDIYLDNDLIRHLFVEAEPMEEAAVTETEK
jgi:small subunit ribosomal protein S6